MEFFHGIYPSSGISFPKHSKNFIKKLKPWIDEITTHSHTNHERTKLQTTEQESWALTYINTMKPENIRFNKWHTHTNHRMQKDRNSKQNNKHGKAHIYTYTYTQT
jgi:hypothetical protein